MKVSIGRIVHFHGFADGPHAAIVTDVPADVPEGVCTLNVFSKSESIDTRFVEHVPYLEQAPVGAPVNGWSWPPREG
jgi:hypothetical protein